MASSVEALGPALYFLYLPNGSTSRGIYAGLGVPTAPLFESLNGFVESRGYPGHVLVQGCGSAAANDRSRSTIIAPAAVGIVAASGSYSLVAAQRAVRQWANLTCVSTDGFESTTLSGRVQTVALGSVDTTTRWRGFTDVPTTAP